MKMLHHALRSINRLLLRLYPAEHQAEFAREMELVFSQVTDEARMRGWLALAGTGLREIGGLLRGAIREQINARRAAVRPIRHGPRQVARARWIARSIAVLAAVWWDSIILLNEDSRPEHLLGVVMMSILVIAGMALGRRRERLGGALVASAGIVLLAGLVVGQNEAWELWSRLPLIALACLPLIIAGALLYDCGRAEAVPPDDHIDQASYPNGRTSGRQALFAAAGALVLALTWYGLFGLLLATTELFLAPWDTFGEPIRPPRGTWERSLNDFFESGPGAYLPSIAALLVSITGLIARLRQPERRASVPWIWAGANIVYFGLVLGVMVLTNMGAALLGVEGIGYHRTWPGIIAMAIGLLALAWLPSRLLFGAAR